MKQVLTLFLTFFTISLQAQLYEMTELGVAVNVEFDGYEGAGFDNPPAAGQLHSGNWASTGLSDGDMVFGGTHTMGDFAKGTTDGGISSGGFYAFVDSASSERMFWIQPTGSDFTPGDLTFRIQNKTGDEVTSFDIYYDLFVLNDGPRSNSFNFSYSVDGGVTFNAISDLDLFSPEEETGSLVGVPKTTIIVGVSVPNDGFFISEMEQRRFIRKWCQG